MDKHWKKELDHEISIMNSQDLTAKQAERYRRKKEIQAKAWAIYYGAPQDTRILCPVNADGSYCDWVAGHYGGHNLARESQQVDYV